MGRAERGSMLTRSFEFQRMKLPTTQGLTGVVKDKHSREQVGDVAVDGKMSQR